MKSPYQKFNPPEIATTQTIVGTGPVLPVNLILLCVVAFFAYLAFSPSKDVTPVDPIDYIDDEPVKPDDDKKEEEVVVDDKVELKGSYLVRVYETEADQQKPWMVKFFDDDSFWFDWVESKEMRIFTFDPGSNPEQSESFVVAARSRGIREPFVIHASGGKVLSVTAIEQSLTTDKLKEIVLSKGK